MGHLPLVSIKASMTLLARCCKVVAVSRSPETNDSCIFTNVCASDRPSAQHTMTDSANIPGHACVQAEASPCT